ncbi:XRE family transcriptional regulator [Acidipropionibacterium jensenii]|uniref:XRE family transcriptional regulator n=1 Tax=Acidipropionibacterium jensenii TaxID=1749 RepID=A0A3Q9UEM8_9ACTN|nr:helix-turn-helix domain-containing protein [Acidipropionibacterium jensenii]AZZ39819.1 XRE family transcriptional regulator [Acidipropionibacterium jensenii]
MSTPSRPDRPDQPQHPHQPDQTHRPRRTPADDAVEHRWVPSARFAAHLRQLRSATGLPWRVLALACGVSPRTVDRLLGGGRPPRRIRQVDARRLLLLDTRALAALELELVKADGTTARLRALVGLGVPLSQLCSELRIDRTELLDLISGRRRRCSAMVRLRTRAACQSRRMWTWSEDVGPTESEEAA